MRRRRQARIRRIKRVSFVALLLLVLLVAVASIVYAGSPGTLARGIRVDGVEVGGLSQAEAVRLLARRSRSALGKPVRFVVAGRAFNLKAADIDLRPDWVAPPSPPPATPATGSPRCAGSGG